jgi:hypothetical protein
VDIKKSENQEKKELVMTIFQEEKQVTRETFRTKRSYKKLQRFSNLEKEQFYSEGNY